MDLHIVMGWPQWTYVALIGFNICVTAIKHGKPQGDYDVRAALAGAALTVFLLVCGGFFG